MENKEKAAGRPKGTGSRLVSVSDLAQLLLDKDCKEVPVPHNWLKSIGADPSAYDTWNRKAIKVNPVVTKPQHDSEQEVEIQSEEKPEIEYSITY